MKLRFWSRRRSKQINTPTKPHYVKGFSAGANRVDFKQQRQQLQRKDRRQKILQRVKPPRFFIIILSGTLLIVLIGFVAQRSLASTGNLKLENVYVFGNQQISDDEIISSLQAEIGTSLLGINAAALESKLVNEFTYIKAAYVQKILPDSLEVEVEERFPVFAYVNRAGAYTIDEDRIVINRVFYEDRPELSDVELRIISGFGDPNSPLVESQYLLQIEDEEDREEVVWEEVPEEDKRLVLNGLAVEYAARVNAGLDEIAANLNEADVVDLPLFRSLEVTEYQDGDSLEQDKFTLAQQVFTYFADKEIILRHLTWQTQFNVIAELDSGLQVYFSSAVPIEEQLEKFESVSKVEDLSKLTYVDLRSELVAVR